MHASELVAHLKECIEQYGDVRVSFAQLQANRCTVRMSAITKHTYGVAGTLFLTNMEQSEVEKHLNI